MAYVSQELKARLAPAIKAALAKYGMRGSIGVRHHSTLVINIASGPLDLIGNHNAACSIRWPDRFQAADKYLQVNVYHYGEHFTGECLALLSEIIDAANVGNFDKSDTQSDYFHVGWYVDVNVGAYNKPYVCTANAGKVAA